MKQVYWLAKSGVLGILETPQPATDCENVAMFCHRCGSTWGSVTNGTPFWHVVYRACLACGGGHFLSDTTIDFLAAGYGWDLFPLEVLRREISLLLTQEQVHAQDETNGNIPHDDSSRDKRTGRA